MTEISSRRGKCNKCWQQGECDPIFTGETPEGYVRFRCCNCLPKRVCVHLDLYEEGEYLPTRTITTRMDLACRSQSYTGTLNDTPTVGIINLGFHYLRNETTGQCFFSLTSSTLGYTGDNVLLLPMGGAYADNATRRQECNDFDWEFPVTVSPPSPYLPDAIIRVVPDDLIEIPRNCADENACFAPEVCITYTDSYGTETKNKVCAVDGQWATEFHDATLDQTITVEIDVENLNPYAGRICDEAPLLKLTSSLNADLITEETLEATCPEMVAEWQFYGGQSIAIEKNPRWALNLFYDCTCVCRCICVTILEDAQFATPPPRAMVGTACMEQLPVEQCGEFYFNGWAVTLVNSEDPYDTVNVNFWLEYDCTQQITYLRTSVSTERKQIMCPDFTDNASPMSEGISWQVSPGGGAQPYLITAKCVACEPCELNPLVATACCPYNPLPAVLTIEVIATNPDCVNLLGEVGSLIWNGSEFEPEWKGFLFGAEFILTCGGNCGDTWCLTGCGSLFMQTAECDPLELTFNGGGGCASCVDPATGDYTVAITA